MIRVEIATANSYYDTKQYFQGFYESLVSEVSETVKIFLSLDTSISS